MQPVSSYRGQKGPKLAPLLCQTNQVNTFAAKFINIIFNIIVPCTHVSSFPVTYYCLLLRGGILQSVPYCGHFVIYCASLPESL
jgi:hypothetical protein